MNNFTRWNHDLLFKAVNIIRTDLIENFTIFSNVWCHFIVIQHPKLLNSPVLISQFQNVGVPIRKL